jgi:glycosyltransferase involved in cell wall biosynthesis
MKPLKKLSVFFPAYNEEANIKSTVMSALKVLPKIADEYEILVINDGSSDNTRAAVEPLGPTVKLINHPTNLGYGAALKTGLTSARYSWICFTDSDGQFRFEEIYRLLPYTKNHDLVVGFREYRTDNPIRRGLAFMLRIWDTLLFGLNLKDVDCGFKLFKKQVVDTINPLVTQSAITETEFMVKAKRAGFTIKEVGVTHHARPEGIQTGAKLKVIFGAFRDSFKLWWHLNVTGR